MNTQYKQCPSCQSIAAIDSGFCSRCGHQFRTQFTVPVTMPTQAMPSPSADADIIQKIPKTHSVLAAGIFSFFLTGGGQFFNQQYGKGAVLLIGSFLGGIFSLLLIYATLGGAIFILPFCWTAFWVANIVDAVLIAFKINDGRPVRKWDWF